MASHQNIQAARIEDSHLQKGNKFGHLFQTLGAEFAMDADMPTLLSLDPGGSDRDVLLPAESKGLFFIISNTADALESLTVKEDSDTTTIASLEQDEAGLFFCATNEAGNLEWKAIVSSAGGVLETAGIIGGAGSSGAEIELGTTSGNAFEYRFRSSVTSGETRGMYLRLDLDAAAVSADALRTFTEIENVAVGVGGTINSIHATMEIDGDSGNISGAGQAIRATLGGSGTKTLTGTLAGINVHLDLPSAVTLSGNEAAIRLTKTQDHEWPVFAAFDSIVGTGNAVEAATSAMSTNATAWAIHIQVDGSDGYIPVYDNKTWS